MKHSLLLCLLFLLSISGWAQEINRYMVFLKDKAGVAYSTHAPEAFLTQRAVERRQKFNIPLTEQDLPVHEGYVDQIKAAGVPVYFRSRWMNAVLVEESAEKVNALKALPFVESILYVAPGKKLGARMREGKQQLAEVPQTQHEFLDIPLMHSMGYTGAGKLIAVLDDGFQGVQSSNKFDHLFRNNQLLHHRDFVGNSDNVFRYDDHGTKSLSTIAVIDSGTFIGTAPNAQFLLAVTEDVATEYIIEEYNWLFACEWADSLGADIITSSLGYTTFDDKSMDHAYSDLDGKTTPAAKAARWATDKGILVVTSAGNNRGKTWGTIGTPADADFILAVGAVNSEGALAAFSSGGPSADGRIKPDVVAHGVGTVVVGRSGVYLRASGTSFAAPQIAGFAAGIWQAFPELSNLEIRERILQSADKSSAPDNDFGWGVPSFYLVTALGEAKVPQMRIYPNPLHASSQAIRIERTTPLPRQVQVQIMDATGRTILKQLLLPGIASKGEIDVSSLPPGIYYLQLLYEKERSVHKFLRL